MQVSKRSSRAINPTSSGLAKTGLPQGIVLVAVLLLFFGATYAAFTQSPRANLFQPPTFTERFFSPWESNSLKRLPIVIGHLNDVFVLPGSRLVWVVGDGGMILHSKDGGISWVQQAYPSAQPAAAAAAMSAPPGLEATRFSLFPAAVAAAEKDPKAQYPNAQYPTTEYSTEQYQTESALPQTSPAQAPVQQYPEQKAMENPSPVQNAPDSNASRMPPKDDMPADLYSVFFEDAKSGVILARDGTVLSTSDGGENWDNSLASDELISRAGERAKQQTNTNYIDQQQQPNLTQNALAQLDASHWLQVGDDGLMIRSDDAGETWYPISRGVFSWAGTAPLSKEELLAGADNIDAAQYRKFPAPWYWLVCCFIIFYGIYFFTRKAEPLPQEESIADLLASDRPLRPGDPDPLGYNSIACGLSRFMRNPNTEPPLTLAITGAWGSGKSSLMNLLYYDLKKFGFTPVWFNAWHHQKGEQLLASLYANIRNQAVPGLFSFSQMIPVGLMFRINLLFRRGVKHWLMTVVLIGVFAASATYLAAHSSASAVNVNKITEVLGAPGFSWETLLIALFGNVAPLLALFQALRAFGLSPLSLMTTQNDRQAQGRVDPSARQQFAREFNEVAKSLSLGRMVIFIDDLDRCSKENVVDILEAINFLSVSGDCYIVLGMDETWVKICIDEHFKEMSKDKSDFSEQYLEKMINIKVPVPQLSETGTSKLLGWDLPDSGSKSESAIAQLWRGMKSALYPYRYFMLMLGVVVLGGCFGFLIDSVFKVESKSVSPVQTIATWDNIELNKLSMGDDNPQFTVSVRSNTMSNASGNLDDSWQLSLNATEEDIKKGIVIGKLGDAKSNAVLVLKGKLSTPKLSENSDVITKENSPSGEALFRTGQQDNFWGDFWLPVLVGILLAIGVIAYSMKMPERRPKDSVEFKEALKIWQPWILLNRQTPRAIKRYLNRIRYMAMRYRTEPDMDSSSVSDGFLRLFRKADTSQQLEQEGDEHLEAKLVALSAIQAANTPWALNVFDIDDIQQQDLQALVADKFGEQAGNSNRAVKLVNQLWDAINMHRDLFGDTIVVDEEKKKDFEKMLIDMQVK